MEHGRDLPARTDPVLLMSLPTMPARAPVGVTVPPRMTLIWAMPQLPSGVWLQPAQVLVLLRGAPVVDSPSAVCSRLVNWKYSGPTGSEMAAAMAPLPRVAPKMALKSFSFNFIAISFSWVVYSYRCRRHQ
jgi:hypothetical protein